MEAKKGIEWRYTSEAITKYHLLFNERKKMYDTDSDEYHQVLVDEANFEREIRQQQAKEDKEREQERLDALKEYMDELKNGIKDWENLISSIVQTPQEQLHDEIKGQIDSWNDFIHKLPKSIGQQFELNIDSKSKKNFEKEINGLLDILRKSGEKGKNPLTEPLIEVIEDIPGQITSKSIANIKNAYSRFKDAVITEIFDSFYKTELEAIEKDEKLTNDKIEIWTDLNKKMAQVSEQDVEDLINQQTQIHNERIGFYDDQINRLGEFLKEVQKYYKEDSSEYQKYTEDVVKLQMAFNEKKFQEELTYNDTVSKLRRDDYNNQLKEIQAEEDLMTKTNKQVYDRAVVDYGDSIELRKRLLDENYEYQKDSLKQQIEVLKEALDDEELMYEEKAKFKEELAKAEMSLTDLQVDYEIEAQRLVNEKIEEGIRKRQALIQQTKEWIQSSLDTMNTYSEAQHMIIDARLAEEEKLLSKRVKAGKLSQEQAKKESEAAKARAEKEFDSTKGIMRAQTMISTLLSAMEAYSSLAGIPYVGPVLGAAAAATALQFGYAQIKQIDATNPYSDNSLGGSDVSSSSTSVTPAIDEYSPNRVSNITGAMETEDLKNAIINQPVWVSISDIDSAQKRVQVKDQETSF
jgi:hypothetical protein